jgi:hypothetical protein
VAKLNFDDIRRGYRKLDYFRQPILFLMARNRWLPKITWPPKVRLFLVPARPVLSLTLVSLTFSPLDSPRPPPAAAHCCLPSPVAAARLYFSLVNPGSDPPAGARPWPRRRLHPPPGLAPSSPVRPCPHSAPHPTPPPPSPPPPPIYLAPAPSKQRKIRTDNITIFVWVSLKKIGP